MAYIICRTSKSKWKVQATDKIINLISLQKIEMDPYKSQQIFISNVPSWNEGLEWDDAESTTQKTKNKYSLIKKIIWQIEMSDIEKYKLTHSDIILWHK